jgi:hypothetical protein
MTSPGRYHDLCTEVRDQTDATGVVVMIYEGEAGTGFSAIGPPEFCEALPAALRHLADQLEAGDRAARMRLS